MRFTEPNCRNLTNPDHCPQLNADYAMLSPRLSAYVGGFLTERFKHDMVEVRHVWGTAGNFIDNFATVH